MPDRYRNKVSGTYPAFREDESEPVAIPVPYAGPSLVKAATRPDDGPVLLGQRFGFWWVRAHLTGGKLEVECLLCRKTHVRTKHAIVSGESTRCAGCAARKAG